MRLTIDKEEEEEVNCDQMKVEHQPELERLAEILNLGLDQIIKDPYKAVRPAMDFLDERDSLYNEAKFLDDNTAEVKRLLIEITPIPTPAT